MHYLALAGLVMCAVLAPAPAAPGPVPIPTTGATPATPLSKEGTMSGTARGTFDVKLAPQPVHSAPGGAELGRMIIDKQFHGDLEAVSTGEMLSTMNTAKGSGGYVAIELVQGSLAGRTGSFVLQHSATMHRGTASLSVTVVPASGTGALAGIEGRMNIIIEKGAHSYEFTYTLPDPS